MPIDAKNLERLLEPLGERNGRLRDALRSAAIADLERREVAAGETLLVEGQEAEALHVVASGTFRVTVSRPGGGELRLSDPGPGSVLGEIAILAGGPHGATVRATTDSVILRLPREAADRIAKDSPEFLASLAETVRRRLGRDQLAAALPALFGEAGEEIFRDVESRGEVRHLGAGEVLFSRGDEPEGIYVVLSGRLRAEGGASTIGEMERGEIVGEIGVISGEPRSATVRAIRDSELLRLSTEAFEEIAARHPPVLRTVARTVVRRLRRREGAGPPKRSSRVFAILPLGGTDVAATAEALAGELSVLGPTKLLSPDVVDRDLGRAGLAGIPDGDPRTPRLEAWLDEQESRHRFLVHATDGSDSPWSRRSLRQADEIVLVADAGAAPAPAAAERALLSRDGSGPIAGRTLVLRHPAGAPLPSGTSRWRDGRRVDRFLHLRADRPEDVSRIARSLAGEAVGLVLGGGGARGLSHIGVIRALGEAGIPIDRIAGTSMGAVISGLYALGFGWEEIAEHNRDGWLRQKVHKEYALPVISLIRSRRIDRMARDVYGKTEVEDLWLPWFCISTNLSTSTARVHESGLVWKAVRASASLPGVFVPVLEDGEVLVDGGIVNNLPGDLMRERSCRTVIVVHVGSEKDFRVGLPEFPSPAQFFWSRLLPFREPIRVPHIVSVILRTTEVSSERKTEEVLNTADISLRPPIEQYGMLEFPALDRIVKAGYDHARAEIASLRKSGRLAEILPPIAAPEPMG